MAFSSGSTINPLGSYPTSLSSPTGGSMDPMSMYLLFGGMGSSALGSIMSAISANNQLQQQNQQFQQTLNSNTQQSTAAALSNFLTQRLGQNNTGLAATQMNPYTQVADLNKLNVQRSFASGYNPATGFTGSFDMSALDPANLAATKSNFDKAVGAAAPYTPSNSTDQNTAAQNEANAEKTAQNNITTFLQGGNSTANDPYGAVKNVYNEVTGGKYTPSQAELTQFGSNIDSNYLNTIRNAVAGWWAKQPQSQGSNG